jgi:hypothetical protein
MPCHGTGGSDPIGANGLSTSSCSAQIGAAGSSGSNRPTMSTTTGATVGRVRLAIVIREPTRSRNARATATDTAAGMGASTTCSVCGQRPSTMRTAAWAWL